MAKIELPYVAWRDGRPRFVPGVRERAMGFKGKDLKHEAGTWFSLDEARAWAIANADAIREQRKTGKKLRAPPAPKGRALRDLWNAYINSDEFKGNPALGVKGLAPSSQGSYKRWVRPLEHEAIWIAPVGSLDPIILKGIHGTVRARHGHAMANYMISAVSAALAWGRLRNWLPRTREGQPITNPASRLHLEALPPRIRIGTDAEIRALVEASDTLTIAGVTMSAIGDAVLTGLFSGQRQKDVLAFIPGQQTQNRVELVQSKTKALVSIPMAPRLIERIEASAARRNRRHNEMPNASARNIVINERTGLPYLGVTFRDHFAEVRAVAVVACPSLADFTFSDLRDTAVTWYARAGCTVPEIASITGHSLKSIYEILKHYLALDAHLADNAVTKLVDYMDRQGLAV